MKVINLYGGPGTGKSTTAADLFAKMKWAGYSVELVDEYAKKVTWEGHHNILLDQLYMSVKQNRKLERLRGKVDYVITDSPLLLGFVYTDDTYYPSYKNLLRELYDSYDNIDIMLHRMKKYDPNGRNQTEDEAKQIDHKIVKMLRTQGVKFEAIAATKDAKNDILEYIQRLEQNNEI